MMIKRITIVLLMIIITISVFSQGKGYVITQNGDSISGEIKLRGANRYYKPSTYIMKSDDGDKIKFLADTIKFMKRGDDCYYILDIEPKKPEKTEKDLMVLIKNNCDSKIYRRLYQKTSNSQYGGAVTIEVFEYYLYFKGKFVITIEKNNFKKLIPMYFPCEEKWVNEIKSKKFKFKKLFI